MAAGGGLRSLFIHGTTALAWISHAAFAVNREWEVAQVSPAMRDCITDFQVGSPSLSGASAGLETRDTADSEVCVTMHSRAV